jgi:hypothetical protein
VCVNIGGEEVEECFNIGNLVEACAWREQVIIWGDKGYPVRRTISEMMQ